MRRDGIVVQRHNILVFLPALRWMSLALLLGAGTISDAFLPQERRINSKNDPFGFQVTSIDFGKTQKYRSTIELAVVATKDDLMVKVDIGGTETEKAAIVKPSKYLAPSPISSKTSKTISREEIERAFELLGITWNELLLPLGQGLLPSNNHNPSSWDEFWELSLKGRQGQLESINNNSSSSSDVLVAEQFTRYLERLGATYVKFGQALSSRPDIVPRSLAVALSKLQDDMDVLYDSAGLATAEGARKVLRMEYTKLASTGGVSPFRDLQEMEAFLATLSEKPVAAASIGVVYSGTLPETDQKVAIKIQRPGVKNIVEKDARLLRRAAEWIESIPSFRDDNDEGNISGQADRFIRTDITGAVDEFMTRLEEELDYKREASNLELFGQLYSHKRIPGSESATSDLINLPSGKDIRVVVPKVYQNLCTDKVLVMEWIDGTKLVDLQASPPPNESEIHAKETEETLELIRQGIDCTLSQLLETGILHADPHGGNLLKVLSDDKTHTSHKSKDHSTGVEAYRLGYIDFGMLSTIPSTVQDGLICAVCQLIFANNVTAVSELFGELQLLPAEILEDPIESAALAEELTLAIGKVLVFPTDEENAIAEAEGRAKIPTLRFDKLLDVLTRLVPRFRFQLPPYFLNNARALATLEGMAREVDPNFNILRHLYPYAIQRIFSNPTNSPIVEGTLKSLIQTPSTGKIDIGKLRKLLKDASNYSGYSRLKVIQDIAKSRSGPGLVGRLAREQTVGRALSKRRRSNKSFKTRHKHRRKRRQWFLDKLANYSRL